jgi:hypothetical protein
MIETRKQAYLEAMGFDVWVARPPEPERDRLVVGPGQGSTLLVCSGPEHSASKLGGDIARLLGGDPVWAWPDPEGDAERPRLEQAVKDALFTRVIVFGEQTARLLLGDSVPAVIVSSSVTVAADFEELATRGSAKQNLWTDIRAQGLAKPDKAL